MSWIAAPKSTALRSTGSDGPRGADPIEQFSGDVVRQRKMCREPGRRTRLAEKVPCLGWHRSEVHLTGRLRVLPAPGANGTEFPSLAPAAAWPGPIRAS